MTLTEIEYNCCLNPTEAEGCHELGDNQPKQTEGACMHTWVRQCSKSDNIVTPKCRAFIDNMNNHSPPLADMDQPIIAFCAMNRTEGDPNYEMCKCVNASNTCLGQKILKYKSGNVGCFYPDCKTETTIKTSDLYAPECRSVTCSIGDITIEGGKGSIIDTKGMVSQNCGNTEPQPPQPSSPYSYQTHSASICNGAWLGKGAISMVPSAGAAKACQVLCDARDDCFAFQTICPSGSPIARSIRT